MEKQFAVNRGASKAKQFPVHNSYPFNRPFAALCVMALLAAAPLFAGPPLDEVLNYFTSQEMGSGYAGPNINWRAEPDFNPDGTVAASGWNTGGGEQIVKSVKPLTWVAVSFEPAETKAYASSSEPSLTVPGAQGKPVVSAMSVHYDSFYGEAAEGYYHATEKAARPDAPGWNTAVISCPRARLDGDQNGRSDFRIVGPEDKDIYIADVRMGFSMEQEASRPMR